MDDVGRPSGDSARSEFLCMAMLGIAWAAMMLLVNPVGDFPLNDDWAYGHTVRHLLEQGEFRPSDWTATNLLFQTMWGALFCLPFGYSFDALRLSTIVLGLVGVLATFGVLREVRAPQWLATLGSLVLACNPLYLALSATFMTDVHFVALATMSLYFLLRGLRLGTTLPIGLGFGFAALAVLTRQLGLALPVGFACAYLCMRGWRLRTLLLVSLPVLAGVALQVAYQLWLQEAAILPAHFGYQIHTLADQLKRGPAAVASDAIRILVYVLIYLGVFLCPVLPLLGLRHLSGRTGGQQAILLVGTALVAAVSGYAVHRYWGGTLMPISKNVLIPTGIGPLTLQGYEGPKGVLGPYRLALTALGALAGAFMAVRLLVVAVRLLAQARRNQVTGEGAAVVLALAVAAVSCAPLPFLGLGTFGFYDRYLIVLIPPLLAALLGSTPGVASLRLKGWAVGVGLALILTLGSFAVAATHDYLAWNRARWVALHELMRERQVPLAHIFGGFEFNGWYLYENYRYDPDWERARFYWADTDDYVATFEPLPGYETLGSHPVTWWLPWAGTRPAVLVQRRIGMQQPPSAEMSPDEDPSPPPGRR